MKRKETVTRVIDGDTIKTSARKHPVRLAGVDAPEKGQPGFVKVTNQLKRLVQGEEVRVYT